MSPNSKTSTSCDGDVNSNERPRSSSANFLGYDPRAFVTTRVTFMTRVPAQTPVAPIRREGKGDWRENLSPAAMESWITDSQFTFVTTDDYYTIITFSKLLFKIIRDLGLPIWTDYASRQVSISAIDFDVLMRHFTSHPNRLVTYESVEVDITDHPAFLKMN